MKYLLLLIALLLAPIVIGMFRKTAPKQRPRASEVPSSPNVADPPRVTILSVESVADDNDRYNHPAVVKIRGEIRAAAEQHADAVSALQALARIDGNTSETERTVVFDFLNRQGAGLGPQHREWFYTSRSGEWYQAAENEVIDELVSQLRETPLQYRVDIIAAATAIVASGGKPKKREAEMLEKLRALI